MGWKPREVREATLNDFEAAFEGYQLANGIDTGPSNSDVEDLESLMRRYPDKT